jgi:DNA-directed RNA polymerase subunit RPC12/RpoP
MVVAVIACSQCGRTPDGPPDATEVPLGWMTEVDRGRRTVVCPDCTRRHARAIEGKLDQAWW